MKFSDQWGELVALRRRVDPAWPLPDPVSPLRLQELQQALGFGIPDQMLEGIGICAGAFEAWSAPYDGENEQNPPPSQELQASEEEIFDYGEVSFLNLESIVDEYESRRAMAADAVAPGMAVGPVRARYFDKRWIPFANDVSAGRFALDLNPDKGGTKGQVIWMYDEGLIVRVVANSFEDFLAYGCECLRYELGELTAKPLPPFQPKDDKAASAELTADPECARIASLWKRIISTAKTMPAPSDVGYEFYKPATVEQIEKVEKRLKAVLPTQLRCSFLTMNIALGMWLQPGKFGSYPIYVGPLSDAVGFSKTIREQLKSGYIVPKDLPALSEHFAFVRLANAGWIRESMAFYVVCSPIPHVLAGKVLMLYVEAHADKEILMPFADDVATFLEQGLARM